MFKFKLEALFKVRKRNKDLVMREWMRQQSQLKILIDDKKKLKEEHSMYKKKYMQSLDKDDRQSVLILKSYLDSFKLRYEQVDKKINKQRESIASIKDKVSSVSREFEIIKKLKEKKMQEYRITLKKKEEKRNDELNILKGKRGKSFGSI